MIWESSVLTQYQAGAMTPTTRQDCRGSSTGEQLQQCWCVYSCPFYMLQTVQGVFSILTVFALFTFSFLSILFSIFFLNMMAQHTHLACSKSNNSTGAHTVKKKMSTVTESWLWFQLLLAHLAEFAEAALVFNVTYIRKAGSSSLPVTVDVSTSTLTHVRPPVMSSLHSPVTTPQPPLCVSDLFFHHIFSFAG